MAATHPIDRLAELSRTFGATAAAEKLRLLDQISGLTRLTTRRIVTLHDTLYCMLAYPDNADILGAVTCLAADLGGMVERHTGGDADCPAFVNTGLPGSCNKHSYSYRALQRMVQIFPGCFSMDWDEINYEPTFVDALNLTVLPSESRGLEDEYQGLQDWLDAAKIKPSETDLEVALRLFRGSSLDARQQVHVFETCEYPVVYRLTRLGSARCDVGVEPDPPCFQRKPLGQERFPLKPKILRPLEHRENLSSEDGRKMIDLALIALCSRNLEIHPLIYANPDDVIVADGGRGLRIILAGVVPEFRAAVETDLFFLVMKNGLPIAYGPASVSFGCCEMGINLFREFRGGEIRYIYSQVMRVLYHVAEVRYFFLTSYGMGDGNPEALKSGAFWFYRKLGFRAAEADVEALARSEEKIMRRKPRYRSSMATLQELALTDAYFDLSGGTCHPVDYEALGHAVSRAVREEYGGDRPKAARGSVARLIRLLAIDDYRSWTRGEKTAMNRLAPILVLLTGLAEWPVKEKQSLVAAIRAKGGPSELSYIRQTSRIRRLPEALLAAASR